MFIEFTTKSSESELFLPLFHQQHMDKPVWWQLENELQ